ncbi:Extracellular ribonuclease precursor [Acholeplasma oculi]|uniref:Endonuclease I n=1 Tax=Acholeplasma oculi TaxID=35623 RepID=A0A061AC14_9MOLU|nr:endonuclease [Acholeplasma oculi]CDR31368.1 Endonuclease I [Acholeplasma oculi]SKC39445.1 Endonuclease I [Acholeplasma oculi]SUT91785.1 Extracellular ribonuclease precursor [Acholeplasma oculi]
MNPSSNPVQISVGGSWTLPTVTAEDDVDGVRIVNKDLSNIASFYDANSSSYIFNQIGTYQITFTADDESGNEANLTLTINVVEGTTYSGYYQSLNGVANNQLVDVLYTLLNDTGQYPTTTYGQARYYLEEADAWHGFNTDYAYLIYTDTLKGAAGSGFPDEGYALALWNYNNDNVASTWNREHVWAKSLFGAGNYEPGDSTRGIDADLHNLRAADTNVNSARGNNLFINQVYNDDGFGNYSSKWYPGDHHRGDVARILFYMDIRWGSMTDLALIGDLQTLIAWHLADPVDQFELTRNEIIYGYQKNRNPFIDHPELVQRIY